MIFNHELCYLHFPKTGGIALSKELVKKLKGQVYYSVPNGHEITKGNEILIEGLRHENYSQAEQLLVDNNFKKRLKDFRCLLLVIRNPYTYIISRYNYLNLNKPWDYGKAAQVARQSTFKDFLIKMPFNYKLETFIKDEEGTIPDNLTLVKFENLKDDLNEHIGAYLYEKIELAHKLNVSKKASVSDYITDQETEEMVYEKFSYLFDAGYYDRMKFSS